MQGFSKEHEHASRQVNDKIPGSAGEAQSLALAHDNQVIEPVHILAAVLADGEGSSRSLLERAGVNVQSLTREVNAAVERLPKVSGTGGDVPDLPRSDEPPQPDGKGGDEAR